MLNEKMGAECPINPNVGVFCTGELFDTLVSHSNICPEVVAPTIKEWLCEIKEARKIGDYW